ncbi:SPOR domain-containing protein [Glaciecola siphonariae]|uniref:SPOR domain-containing protein n=1 Tax=Glaciecola siphonariae TaxID=521012 RepID=A0ABV9LXC7_9ALTE
MAQTDYVSRGQKRKKKAPKKAPTPWLRIVLALAVVGGLAYGLFALQQAGIDTSNSDNAVQKPQQGATQIEQQQNAASASSLSESNSNPTKTQPTSDVDIAQPSLDREPLPTLGEEEWAFIDALPEYSVEVDIPDEVASDRKYIMQCGSFRTTERAEELRAKLALQGFEAQMLQSDGQNGRWYRVVMGPYERKRAAERDRHQVRRANINNCKIY